jgi:hypothetical protein
MLPFHVLMQIREVAIAAGTDTLLDAGAELRQLALASAKLALCHADLPAQSIRFGAGLL